MTKYGLFFLLFYTGIYAESLVLHEPVSVDAADQVKVLRGGAYFKSSCLSCHSLKYWRYDSLAKELGIDETVMPNWPDDSWGGHPPPDLSLIALEYGVSWLYTYLHAYYLDESRPTGFNNLAMLHTSMPNPFADIQGVNTLKRGLSIAKLRSRPKQHWYQVVDFGPHGSFSPQEFDLYVEDIVTFLSYVSDPSVVERRQLGPWVIGYGVLAISLSLYIWIVRKKDMATKPKTRK